MEKFPFSPTGVQDLLTQIYELPNTQLNQEGASVAADFRSWIKNNFELESTQMFYLDSIDNQFIVYAALKIQYFILNRLPITLIKAGSPEKESIASSQDKIVVVNNPKETKYSPENGYFEEEQLTFTISYT